MRIGRFERTGFLITKIASYRYSLREYQWAYSIYQTYLVNKIKAYSLKNI